MKRALIASLLLLALVIATWGCDVSGLPTPTAVQSTPAPSAAIAPTSTAASSSATPVPAASADTAASVATPAATDTSAPATETSTLPSPTFAASPTLTPYLVEDTPTTSRPVRIVTPVTRTPKPTRTPLGPTRTPSGPTPTLANPPPTKGPAEPAPTGGWSEVVRVPPGKHRVALTFDAGGTGETIPAVLNTLRERHINITMFITGKFAEQYPDGVKQMVADGNELANHTYSHF